MVEEKVISKCGCHCYRCPAFKGQRGTEADREEGSALWEKYFGLHFKPSLIRCTGCQSAEPWKTGNQLPSRSCVIRACAIYNGVPTCAHCSLFPCQEFLKYAPGANLRQQREEASNIKISDAEYLQYLEPFEGQTHLKELHNTLSPQDIIKPKPFASMNETAAFTEHSGLPPADEAVWKNLHALLTKAFSQIAPNYAGQIVLERKQIYLRGMVWAFARYGRLQDGLLVIESAVCGQQKVCSRMVRKTDNRLHDAIQEAADNLKQFGLQVEFTPLKRTWKMSLRFSDSAGGLRAVQALQTWVSGLVEKYGEPLYIDGFNLRGPAFKRFIRLDMSK